MDGETAKVKIDIPKESAAKKEMVEKKKDNIQKNNMKAGLLPKNLVVQKEHATLLKVNAKHMSKKKKKKDESQKEKDGTRKN